MDIQIPCIRKMKWDQGGGTTVDFSFSDKGDFSFDVYILITPEDSPVSIEIAPYPPFVIPLPNFEVIFDDLFGKSRIQIQKDEIQKYLTQIFRYIFNTYGYPLHDSHALQFKSSGVRREFLRRPDLAILAEAMWTDADAIIVGSFGYDKSGPGIHERFVNQFLANASYNNWPLQATLDLWHAIVKASTCPKPTAAPPEPLPPEPPPPPPPPPPEPQRECPPGWSMDDCLVACGRIRQLTAAQMPMPLELAAVLDYFRDCILPPDGSWQYAAPIIQEGWGTTFTQRYAFLPSDAVVVSVPPWAWPYNWAETTQVDEIKFAGTRGVWPEGTVLVIEPGKGDYVITPDGEVHCSVPPPTGVPDPPDVDDPEEPELPDDPTPRLDDLQQQVWALRTEFEQFKEVAFAADMSLRHAVWNGFIRSNMQAAEVYAKDQPQWSGPPPGAQEPPFPPAWQDYPAPGGSQVLEIPAIQEFPQVLEVPPFDPTYLEVELSNLENTNSQQWNQILEIEQRVPMLISEGINTYDQDVEKPDIQAIRDECCQPVAPPPEPEPVDYCQLGREWWGQMAECWLADNTGDPGEIDAPFITDPTALSIAEDVAARFTSEQGGRFAPGANAGAALAVAAFLGQTPTLAPYPYTFPPVEGYIFAPVPALTEPVV